MNERNDEAYKALRWFAPDLVRTIRGALDNGVDVSKLRRSVMRREGEMEDKQQVLDAIDYMSANPSAGAIRWTEGEQYVFVEEEPADDQQ